MSNDELKSTLKDRAWRDVTKIRGKVEESAKVVCYERAD